MTRTMVGSLFVVCCGLAVMPLLVQPVARSVSDAQDTARLIVVKDEFRSQGLHAEMPMEHAPATPAVVLLAVAR